MALRELISVTFVIAKISKRLQIIDISRFTPKT